MHDGEFRLKTFIGGILSIIIFSIILIYLFILILMPIKLVSNNAGRHLFHDIDYYQYLVLSIIFCI